MDKKITHHSVNFLDYFCRKVLNTQQNYSSWSLTWKDAVDATGQKELSLLQRAIRASWFWLTAKTAWQEEVVETVEQRNDIGQPAYRGHTLLTEQTCRVRVKVPLSDAVRRQRITFRMVLVATVFITAIFGAWHYFSGSMPTVTPLTTISPYESLPIGHMIQNLSLWWLVPIILLAEYGMIISLLPKPIHSDLPFNAVNLNAEIFGSLVCLLTTAIVGSFLTEGLLNVTLFALVTTASSMGLIVGLFFPLKFEGLRAATISFNTVLGLIAAVINSISLAVGYTNILAPTLLVGVGLFFLLALLPPVITAACIAIAHMIRVLAARKIFADVLAPISRHIGNYFSNALDDSSLPARNDEDD